MLSNMSLKLGYVPSDFCYSVIKPLVKIQEAQLSLKYRAIPRDALRQLKSCPLMHSCTKKIIFERLAVGEPCRTLNCLG